MKKKSNVSVFKCLGFSLIIVVVMVVTIMSIITIRRNNLNKKFEDAKYITYTVKQFDTLWGIAKEYNEFDVSTRDYVSKLFEMNNLKTDVLQIGQSLILIVPNK